MKPFHDQVIKRPVRDGALIGYRLGRVEKQPHAIVMIHGLASNSTRWTEFVNDTSLQKHWELLRIDLRGHGLSLYRGHISRKRWCEDLRDVLAAEHYRDIVIIGHSQGAQVAMQYAQEDQTGLRGLVLIDPVFDTNLTGTLGVARRLKWLLWLGVRFLWLLNRLGIRRRHFPLRDLYALDRRTRDYLATHPDKQIADIYMRPTADFGYIPLANYLQDVIEVVRPLGPLQTITCPVLVLLSKGATMSNVDKNTQIIRQMPNSKIEYIDADHWLLTEKPQQARAVIEAWVNGLGR
ncbi:MAG: alpha/beta hydrolase [Gammaproteobacteria bacterium]|nr:alpha/beta hydrolase [Gammaproteobacteria bacterium]MDH5654068.1 alpha/beta hydrolase [Gammaproteobacteria bacterium]